jgi:hypothetical protein
LKENLWEKANNEFEERWRNGVCERRQQRSTGGDLIVNIMDSFDSMYLTTANCDNIRIINYQDLLEILKIWEIRGGEKEKKRIWVSKYPRLRAISCDFDSSV